MKIEEYTVHEKVIYGKINYEDIGKRFIEQQERIKLRRLRNPNKGEPDYYYIKRRNKTYIEFKCPNDGLRKEQLLFCLKHKNVRIIWINVTYNKKKPIEDLLNQIIDKIHTHKSTHKTP